jgi:phage terminase large subunit-like protein
MVLGPAGFLACHDKDFRPEYFPSKRLVEWPNGAQAILFNAVEPDQLRGPQFDLAWCDELAKWRYAQETWDQLQFGLRLGEHPRQIVTTTPRPIPVVRGLVNDPTCFVTRGRTYDNAANLAAPFLKQVEERYGNTRLGRQELEGEILDDMPGALWNRDMLDGNRKPEAPELTVLSSQLTLPPQAEKTLMKPALSPLGLRVMLMDASGATLLLTVHFEALLMSGLLPQSASTTNSTPTAS